MLELWLIRHAPVQQGGRLIGRTDPAAEPPAAAPPQLGEIAQLWSSPARRCRETAVWLFPGRAPRSEPALWEQDFGAWDGQPYAALPDLGALPRAALAAHRPPGGESFLDLAARWAGLLPKIPTPGPVAIVAHAGVIRAALGLALGAPEAGLSFEIAPLSLTRLTRFEGGWSIGAVNLPLLPEAQA